MKFTHFPPILVLVIAGFLVLGGYQWGKLTPGTVPQVHQAQNVPLSIHAQPPAGVNFDIFWETWNKLSQNYAGTITSDELVEGAVRGLVQAADDPYTDYLDPQTAQELNAGLQGVFSGIGAEIGVKDQALVIVAPLPGSPAEEAGLRSQDQIIEIDGQSVADMSFIDAIRAIRGEEGTEVALTILRANEVEAKTISVTRREIIVKSVESSTRPDGIGYLKITSFHEDTTQLTREALLAFTQKSDLRGVILDLRGNPGGLLDQGISVASLFLDSGVVVKQENKDGTVTDFSTSRPAVYPKGQLVVLIDEGSASAAEIVAGALHDHKRATLVGAQTFGKGSVQELIDLSNQGQLKVTIAHWLTPNGRTINEVGITPDIVVESSAVTDVEDPQLARAAEEIK